MKRNLVMAILTPCILACILIVLIIMDNNRNSRKASLPEGNEPEVVSVTPPADTISPMPSSEPTRMPEETQEPTTAPTTAPTKVPSKAPTPTASITPTTAPVSSPTPVPSQNPVDITGAPSISDGTNEPGHGNESGTAGSEQENGTAEPGQTGEIDAQEPGTYQAIYKLESDDYTLIADGITDSYLFISSKDGSIRQTAFMFAPIYEEDPGNFPGPVIGYKNKTFFLLAGSQIVASDGMTETVLLTFDESVVHPNMILQSENRFLAGFSGDTLVVIDSRTCLAEVYKQSFTADFLIFTDDALCFNYRRKIPASAYYNYLYTARDGNIKLHGIIGEIDDYAMEGDSVIIRSQDDLFKLDLKQNTLTTSKQMYREYMLYLPVYSTGILEGLSDMRFINYNADGDPVQTIQLPSSWTADCYYYDYVEPSLSFFYDIHDRENEKFLPGGAAGTFTLVDKNSFPLAEGKYLMHSSVKEELYSGSSSFGPAEIYLLERMETKNDGSGNLEDVLYEIIYAWIPIEGESQAYQFYLYVPQGKEAADYLTVMKYLINAN